MQYDLSILFHLQKGKENKKGEVPIYLRITVNGKRAELSTNESINTTLWDSGQQRAKGRSECARTLNYHLDSLENKVKREYNSMLEHEQEISALIIRDKLTGKNQKEGLLLEVFKKNNILIELEEGQKYTRSTINQ